MFLFDYNYRNWDEKEEELADTIPKKSADLPLVEEKHVTTPPMSQLEGDREEVKEGITIKLLTLNKLLSRLPILLAQIKAKNNLYK